MNLTEPVVSNLPCRDILLNASALKLTNCPQRWHNRCVLGLVSTEEREELVFGKAVHRYAEQRIRGADFIAAAGLAQQGYEGPNKDSLMLTCTQMPPDLITPYVDSSGRKYLELKFKVFWKSVVYDGTQYNIWICGTFDAVSMFADGSVRILDYKTSRKWKFSDVFYSYRVSVQMAFYAWAAYKFGHHIFDMIVANATTMNNQFVQICGVFLSAKPPVWKLGPPIQASVEELTAFEELVSRQVDEMILAYDNPSMTGKVNDTCDYCEYTQICFADNPTHREQAVASYNVIKYDPAAW